MKICMTLGMLSDGQASAMAVAGLDFHNHNIDTSSEYFCEVITTHSFWDPLQALDCVRLVGTKVCCGGIVEMGKSRADHVGLIHALANLPRSPESIPVNAPVSIEDTVLGDLMNEVSSGPKDDSEFIRTVAAARIMMHGSMERLSARRENMSDAAQALCFMAGASSTFEGDRLVTTSNPGDDCKAELPARLGMRSILGSAKSARARPPIFRRIKTTSAARKPTRQ